MVGIRVKRCHRVAGPVWLFNHRPICSFSRRRNIGEYFLNGICGVSNVLVCDVYYLLKGCKGNHCRRYVVISNGNPTQWCILFHAGALSTLVASYLARARGSNEPELSIARTKDLEQFIRECRAFQMDHGHMVGNDCDNELVRFRNRYEELLGNNGNEWVFFFNAFSNCMPNLDVCYDRERKLSAV